MNVREAFSETEELTSRYELAKADCHKKGLDDVRERFETAVANDSEVVVNLKIPVLKKLVKERLPYKNDYDLRAEGQAMPENRQRQAVDFLLFGSYGSRLYYGCLSLDREGATSYGGIGLVLDSKQFQDRISFMHQNTFHLIHGLSGEGKSKRTPLPVPDPGHRSVWEERHKLAVAKHANDLDPAMTNDAFPSLLLVSAEKKEDDEFIEAHIFGQFSLKDVTAITFRGPTPGKQDDVLEDIRDALEEEYNLRIEVRS